MNIKKVVGDLPQPKTTRESGTSAIVEQARTLSVGEFIEIECTKKEANKIRQAMYRHLPSVKSRVNERASGDYLVILHVREEQKKQDRPFDATTSIKNKTVNCCGG